MTLTLADIPKWNPEAIRDVAKALTKKGASAQEVADGLKKLPIIASWEGQAGTAAKESLGRLSMFLTTHADNMETLNKALLKAADDVEAVRRDFSAMQTDADNWHFNINLQTGAVTATDATDESTADAHKTELEGDVSRVLATANGVDQELATALSNATGAPSANGDPTPGSLPDILDRITPHPPAPNERLSAAEQFIYDEMMRNVNSDQVKDIKHLLEKPKWYEIGRNPPSDYTSALAGWAAMVAPRQPWDHKPILERKFGLRDADDFFFPQPGTDRKVFYDIFSNIHYGFVGSAAGIDPDTLIKGASIAEPILVGHDDYGDQITMRAGIDLFNRYGPNMTAQQFHTGLIDVINQMDAAQRAGKEVPQIRHVPG